MEVQNAYEQEVHQLFARFSPPPSVPARLANFLKQECRGSVQTTQQFLNTLERHPIIAINFDSFCTIVRIIKKTVLKHNNDKQKKQLADFIITHSKMYFPYLKHVNPKQFQQILALISGLPVSEPTESNEHRRILFHLWGGKYSQNFANKLVEQINNEVLIERKSQSSNNLKINQFFGAFLVIHMERLIPSLERLLVRNENNIEVWADFFLTVDHWKGIDAMALPILTKIKGLFLTQSDHCVRIVNCLTNELTDEKYIKEILVFLSGLVSGQHNAKRKVVYVRMLQGIINSVKKLSDEKTRNIFGQELAVTVANSLIKFTDEEQFNILVHAVDSICQLVTDPKDDVSKVLKLYLKNQNKHIQILTAIFLSNLYREEHINSLPATKQIYNHFKTQLPTLLKKAETNWQILIPILNFMSKNDLQFAQHVSQDLPIFKVSCLALSKPEMKVSLNLILKKIQFMKSQEEQIGDFVYSISALLLEQIKQQATWKSFLSELSPIEKTHLITKGICPLILFTCSDLKKNKGKNFTSLLRYMKKTFKGDKIEIDSAEQFAKLVACFRTDKDFVNKTFALTCQEDFNSLIQKYVRSSLFDWQNDDENLINIKQKVLIETMTSSMLSYQQHYLIELLDLFTTEDYYKKDLQFLIDFEQKMFGDAKQVKEQLLGWRQTLSERQIHKVEEIKSKKVYIGMTIEAKMMSQQQVKEEKYRQHFMKMVRIFDLIVAHFLNNFSSHQMVTQLWKRLMKKLLSITMHAQHRLGVLKLVKRSHLYTAWFNQKQQQSKIFLKHAEFLGQFFSVRNSNITPSVKMMTRCEVFLKQLLALPFDEKDSNFKMLQEQNSQFVMLFINEMCEYLLKNMQFDVNLKKLAIKFYYKCSQKNIIFNNEQVLFTYIAQNINILSNSEHIQPLLIDLVKKVNENRIKELFTDILNYIQTTKKLILNTINLVDITYKPQFEEYIKLKILSLESNEEISKLASKALTSEVELKKSILTFNMKNFVKMNSKQTIEKLCQFIKEEITTENAEPIFLMVLKASEELFDENFDQEGLQMLPYFLDLNIEHINEALFKPVFSLLTIKFTSKEEFGTLTKKCVEIGIDIIKRNAKKHAQKLLLVLESFISKASGVSNIIFLGVLAPYLQGHKNLQIIQQRITELFKGNREGDQRAISKCMQDLMSFFKNPEQIIQQIFINIGTMKQELQVGQSYLFSGLLKGVGYEHTQLYLEKIISSDYITKTRSQKLGRVYLINAMVENFGRVVEIKAIEFISIILGYMADNIEDVRNLAKQTGQKLVLKMSSFSVKILLPQLLTGLEEEQNWRVKISYIWILGVMANSSAKQLQTSLPVIVPGLSSCLSNAHPTIRQKASEALNLIGETIKNPEISNCVDILITALQNPFDNSVKAIDLLLKTNFNHYIDPPSLSMIIPILDYCMRGRISDMKAGACQVMGAIVELIANPYDLLPYLRIILTGIKIALCDPLPEIRRIASMAIGKIATKIGIKDAEEYFKFVTDIIESSTSNSIERQGAAQAYAEIICSQTYQYFEESLYKLFQKLNSVKHSEKQGYILIFLFIPMIRTQQFEGFIKQVNENMYSFVSDEDEVIRNAAMLVEKVLINNYCMSHTDLLLQPLCDGAFDNNWKKRNAAIILIGEILNIIKSHMYNTRSNDKAYAYYRGLMCVYIIKDDELEMSRMTAIQVWNTYIENTPKTIRAGIQQLVKMWTKWTHATGGVVFKNIVAFSTKYGENYFTEILDYLPQYLKQPEHQVGVFEVLSQFIKRLNKDFLSRKGYRELITQLFTENLFVISEVVRPALAKCLALYVDKMGQERYFEDLLYPTINKMDQTDEANADYTYNLHLIKDLLNTNSNKVVDRVINKVMQTPLSEFKIEVITNNADRLSNYLYSHFKRPATELLIQEVLSLVGDKSKENRLNLIIYCLEQVSLKLQPKYKTEFMRMINKNITSRMEIYNNEKSLSNKKILQIFVNMILFFLNSTPLSEIDDLEIIVGQISPLIFIGDDDLSALGHKIYLLVISDHKSFKTSEYIRQMRVSFENNMTKEGQNIWEHDSILKDYISILVKGVAYGREQVMEESLDLIEFMVSHTSRNLAQKYILRIVGPVIRISNYPLLQKQKIRIMELLIKIRNQKFNLDAYNNQMLSVCLRLLQQFKSSEEVIQVVSNTYYSMINNSVLKKELVHAIISKLKTMGGNLMQTVYYLIKNIIKERMELPKTIFEKIHDDVNSILLNTNQKNTPKSIYYASKATARLGVFLGKPIEKIESQLKGLTVPYEVILNYLHYAYYKKARITRMESIQIFIKQSNRQKVNYLLRSLHACTRNSEEVSKLYSQEYIKRLVPEGLSGFEEIAEIMDEFESEVKDIEAQGEINQS